MTVNDSKNESNDKYVPWKFHCHYLRSLLESAYRDSCLQNPEAEPTYETFGTQWRKAMKILLDFLWCLW